MSSKRYNASDLNDSGVIFNEARHTYMLNGRLLKGVTRMIGEVLFPDKYANVPESVLNAAKEYGHYIHSQIEKYIKCKDWTDEDTISTFTILCGDRTAIKSEYTVTDYSAFASNIDVVLDDLSLVDIKTTSKLDVESVSWQLSFYAEWFEQVNPHLKAGKLYAMWLPNPEKNYGRPQMVEVPRKSKEELDNVMAAYLFGVELTVGSKTPAVQDDVPVEVRKLFEVEKQIAAFERQVKEWNTERDRLHEAVRVLMEKTGSTRIETGAMTISYVNATTRTSFDLNALKTAENALYEELFAKYNKTSNVKSSIKVKLKNQ